MSFQDFRQECEKIAGQYSKLLEVPKKEECDLCIPCFSLGNPVETAKKLAEEFNEKIEKNSLIKEIKATGPYVNFYIDAEKFSKESLKEIISKKEYYGSAKKKDRIILEHTSMNPSGPVHVGRIRNTLIGDSLKRILEFAGHDVETHYYVNDVGKQIAIITLAKDTVKPKEELIKQYEKYKTKEDFQTFFIYVAANENVDEKEVSGFIQKCEAGDIESLEKLKETAAYCLQGQKKIFERMGIFFDKFDFESKYIEDGSAKDVLKKLGNKMMEKDGALGVDLTPFNLERKFAVLARSDGTSVYILRDIAYHIEKFKLGGRSIRVLGEDHKNESVELKKILELLGEKKPLDDIFYAFVNFKGMRLSTRLGQTAPVDMLLDEGMEKALEKIDDKKIAESVVFAAVKYHILKTDLMKQINFLWDDALRFEGDTGPYLQYTYARANSILKKSVRRPKIGEYNEKEISLIKKLSKFPDVVESTAENMKPHQICSYLHDISAQFNEYYHAERVIDSDNEEAKLALIEAFTIVLKSGLHLLGIEILEKM